MGTVPGGGGGPPAGRPRPVTPRGTPDGATLPRQMGGLRSPDSYLGAGDMTTRTWRLLVSLAVLVGLAIRVGSVLGRPHLAAAGDPAEYLGQANLLAEGKGWIEPLIYAKTGTAAQTAKLPPLYTMLLALCSVVGLKSFFAHRIWSAILSSAGVVLGALLGREVAGRTVGVVTAFGIAIYPNIWMPASLGMSETISPVLVTLVLWLAYRMWRQPSVGRVVALGAAIGFAALARGELAVLVLFILVPLALIERGQPWRRRLQMVGAGILACLVVVVPWVTFNAVRFSHTVLVSDEFGVTLAASNCGASWHGPFVGYWSMPCALASVGGVHGDESADDPVATRKGLRYIGDHVGGLPGVEFDRLGRTFGFYRVSQQMNLDINVEGRPHRWAWVGLWSFYGLVLLAPFGMWTLKRGGIPLFPLWAVLADVVLVVLVTYGQTRFRATLEPVLVLLGAVTLCAAAAHSPPVRRRTTASLPGPDPVAPVAYGG